MCLSTSPLALPFDRAHLACLPRRAHRTRPQATPWLTPKTAIIKLRARYGVEPEMPAEAWAGFWPNACSGSLTTRAEFTCTAKFRAPNYQVAAMTLVGQTDTVVPCA